MDVPASVERLGFRKWYERELIKSHAALVTCFLCGVLVAAMVETLEIGRGAWKPLSMLGMFAAAVVGWMSWRSYITMLNRAERYGERSTCPNCADYGRFKVLESGREVTPSEGAVAVAPLDYMWMQVECRKCGTAWRMPE